MISIPSEMPVVRGTTLKGPYYKWGKTGHPYHYAAGNKASRNRAYACALRQGQAILASRSRRQRKRSKWTR